MQSIIIHRSNSHDLVPGETRSDAVHQRPTDGAEVIRHFATGLDGVALGVAREFVFAAEVLDPWVCDNEVGGEHRCCDFAAAVGEKKRRRA